MSCLGQCFTECADELYSHAEDAEDAEDAVEGCERGLDREIDPRESAKADFVWL
jgi:hypothetical protein